MRRLAVATFVLLAAMGTTTVHGSTLVPQTVLPGECIPQFATPLLTFGPDNATAARVDALRHPALTVKMKEGQRNVIPPGSGFPLMQADNVTACPSVKIQPTRIWAYETSDSFTGKVLGPAFWPAVTIEARRYVPTVVTYVNELPSFNPSNPTGPGYLQGLITVDQTIDYANPLLPKGQMGCMGPACFQPYVGPVPSVPHLHGGEVPSQFDGGPNAWFTPNGIKGPDYSSLWPTAPNKAVYLYNNTQEPGTPWFHDHAMGATRTNVYSGLAGFFFIRDPANEPANLPKGAYEIEMAIQDRQFDVNSQLFFPDGSGADNAVTNLNGPPGNPTVHPFWIPEFFGDVAVVNGSPWPLKEVEPRRYRFRIVEGSNARVYRLRFVASNGAAVPVYAIGSDDSYLDAPVPIDNLFMAPGERYDILVDFAGLPDNTTVTVTNDAPAPYPSGMSPVPYPAPPPVPGMAQCMNGVPDAAGMCPADQPTMANIMQFRVSLPLAGGQDTSCNPAAGQCKRPKGLVRLTDGKGTQLVAVDQVRQLVLKEHPDATTGAPLEVLVNNSYFMGNMSANLVPLNRQDGVSELPRQGSTELWEIINLTMDAHPMHTHLAQFQVLNRQTFNDNGANPGAPNSYPADWAAAFGDPRSAPLPANCVAGQVCYGYGPPGPYNTPNADGALGGNPALSPYLDNVVNPPMPPAPEESGWKDTAKAFPGQVMRMLVRWAPTSTPVASVKAGVNKYPFDPTAGPGYVWHCHIIDHEDNDMMRPYKVAR
jgi:FtsP/CotA-like multicopper oxidase with cupredoxin domain